jgi:trehalose 6-phosphate synthase
MRQPQRQADRSGTGRSAADSDAASGSELLVVSNRQPYRHEYDDGDGIEVDRPAGGLTAGLDAVMRSLDGTWIAWGDGTADRAVVDPDDRVVVPPERDDGRYVLERVWLDDEQVDNYYYGFSNRVLWPVCHSALTNVSPEPGFWDHYRGVNEQFADAIAAAAGDAPTVWFHDYHLGLAPGRVREALGPAAFLLHTWHIPWPSWDVFRACPRGRELLEGLLGNDLIGFHVPRYCDNFLECVGAALPDARVDWEHRRVHYRGERTAVRSFPMGVDAERRNRQAASPEAEAFWERFAEAHGLADVRVGVGVDRLDYTKGLVPRIDALEQLWASNPGWRGAFSYVQVGTESRSQIAAYSRYQSAVEDAVERVNGRFGTEDWQPIAYTTEMLDDEALAGLYRFADVALVTPVRDGMNLVAQEYVAAQQDNHGALVLSDQAGAHDELHDWVCSVNPNDVAGMAAAIDRALTLPPGERRSRMARLRRHVGANDISAWIDEVFGAVRALRGQARRAQQHVNA